MRAWTTRIGWMVGGAAVAVIVAVSALGTVNAAGAAVATKPGGKTTVTVGDNYYKPEDIEITAGTKVTWANKGRILHSVTPDKGKLYGAKTLPKGKKYSFTFKKPGTYAYHCTFHGAPGSGQHGTIVVKAAAPPTTTTTAGP